MVSRHFLISLTFITLSLLSVFLLIQFFPLSGPNKVLLISMDGFRHDYIEKTKNAGIKLPNFDKIISMGSRVIQMENAFPTITLPNHQTLLTGMYTETHGIVLNTFIDAKLNNSRFDMNNQDNLNDPIWFKRWPEPIWVTMQKNQRLTASHLWPLTDTPVYNQLPYFQESQYTYLDNNPIFDFNKRVDDMVRWIGDTHVNIELGLLYYPEPDESGHSYGPNDIRIYRVIERLDGVLGHLLTSLQQHRHNSAISADNINIILTADHGMSELSTQRYIALNDYIDPKWYSYTLLTPVSAIYPVAGKEQAVYNGLKGKNPHLEVYWRHEVPAYLNYNQDNGRIAPLILIAENRWNIVQQAPKPAPPQYYGNHGYKPNETDVQPVFIAWGPDFKSNYTHQYARSVDVYPLMCHLLRLSPNPNNGSLARIQDILTPKNTFNQMKTTLKDFQTKIKSYKEYILLAEICLLVLLLLGCCLSKSKYREHRYNKLDNEAY